MNKDAFIESYLDFLPLALNLAAKARKESLLGLDKDIDQEKADNRDIFHYGLRFAVDGISEAIINTILSNIIEQDTNEYSRRFKTMQKETVLWLQAGVNPEILHYVLNSYTDIPIKDEGCPA